MDKAALLALADRVEALDGPCRATDWEIHCRNGMEGVGLYGEHPSYTASLNAAMTLVPEGCVFKVMTDFGLPGRATVYGTVLPGQIKDRGWKADGATPALTLTAAAIRAIANGGDDE